MHRLSVKKSELANEIAFDLLSQAYRQLAAGFFAANARFTLDTLLEVENDITSVQIEIEPASAAAGRRILAAASAKVQGALIEAIDTVMASAPSDRPPPNDKTPGPLRTKIGP